MHFSESSFGYPKNNLKNEDPIHTSRENVVLHMDLELVKCKTKHYCYSVTKLCGYFIII